MTLSRNFVLSNLYIGVQKNSTEPIIRRKSGLDGIEAYLYLRNDGMTQKINHDVLKAAGLSESEAWAKAEENTDSETKIMSLAEAICGVDDGNPLYVISNTYGYNGAGNITDKKALHKFGKDHNTDKIAVLPSSIHEMLILPADLLPFEELSKMVKEVNETEVQEDERLTDRAYIVAV